MPADLCSGPATYPTSGRLTSLTAGWAALADLGWCVERGLSVPSPSEAMCLAEVPRGGCLMGPWPSVQGQGGQHLPTEQGAHASL